jgi:hypothetical protein
MALIAAVFPLLLVPVMAVSPSMTIEESLID